MPLEVGNTGRLSFLYTGLTLQGYPLTKAIVTFFKDYEINEQNFDQYKKILLKYINLPKLREPYESMTYKEYKEKTVELQWDQIQSFFNLPDDADNTFFKIRIKNPTDFNKTLKLLDPYIKNAKNIFLVLALLLQKHLPNADIDMPFAYDASNNGFQIISMLLKQKDTAKLCALKI